MGECAIIEFDYMWKDTVCTHVRMQGFSVEVSNKTDGIEDTWFYNAFGNAREEDVTYEDVESFLEERCFPRTRANCQELLDSVGLEYYDALDIVRITHGIMTDDCFWIRFEGETLKWNDICQDWRNKATPHFVRYCPKIYNLRIQTSSLIGRAISLQVLSIFTLNRVLFIHQS